MTFQRSSASECERQCSPTKFEAARSRFFVGRDGVSHPRNAEMRFSFRRSPLQIEFLARETPNCTLPRTCTHIPSMDMRERERFASQGAKRRGRNPQRCYDPSDDRDGTAGVPSTQPVLVREPTSAFSSLGRLVLSSMLDAMEQGAQRPEESTIIPFSESRYRSSDVGRAHLQTGEAHLL